MLACGTYYSNFYNSKKNAFCNPVQFKSISKSSCMPYNTKMYKMKIGTKTILKIYRLCAVCTDKRQYVPWEILR